LERAEQEPIEIFLYAIRAEETKRGYTAKLKVFFDYIGLKGKLSEQAKETVVKARKDTNWALASIMQFMTYQKERVERKEITESTLRNYYKPLKLFCEMNDIALSWKKITKGLPKARRAANDRAPTLEEIRIIAEYPDRRMKSIVYVMTSSGMRLGAWDYLKWRHIEPMIDNGNAVAAKVIIYAGDSEEYITFITSEAYKAVKEWMDYRAECGEKITKDSWVMRDLWQAEYAHHGLATHPRKLKSTGIKRLIERALWSQGIRKPLEHGEKRHEFKTDHGFRKYFKTRTEQVMKPINVEWLMGHSTGISDSYYRPNEHELLTDYLKAVPFLQISETEHVKHELAVAEKNWQNQFEEMKVRFDFVENRLNLVYSTVLASKMTALQEANQSQDRTSDI